MGASRKSGSVDFSSIGAEMSRHVGAKSQRFSDFNFSKALMLSFLKKQSHNLKNRKNLSNNSNFKTNKMDRQIRLSIDEQFNEQVKLLEELLRIEEQIKNEIKARHSGYSFVSTCYSWSLYI